VETVLAGRDKKVVISRNRPTILIGERINPAGRKRLAQAMRTGDLGPVGQEACAQADEGAEVIDVNVGLTDIDETALLPQAVRVVSQATGLPVCIDTSNAEALEAALAQCDGKPLVNSVTGEQHSLHRILPIVQQHGAAVIALVTDEQGIPQDADTRLRIAEKILVQAAKHGIPEEDVIIDPLVLSAGADQRASVTTLETIHLLAKELGVNVTLGGSNVSFGLPDRDSVNGVFLALAIAAGVTCPIVNPRSARRAALIADLLLGRDEFAMRYIAFSRRSRREPDLMSRR
jgi:5-methyltetrahydrofolate--homocysteine methyltransferase